MSVQDRYMSQMETLASISVPRANRVIAWLLLFAIVVGLGILWFTPWVQTATGSGVVSALQPEQRTQAISALVPGQIARWHVKEGDRIKAGDPIVTLVDTDQELISRLRAQIAATEQQLAANSSAIRTAELDITRRKNLLQQGLVSKREVEQLEIGLEELKAKEAATNSELNQVRVGLARQSIQTKVAPSDGTILRLLSAGTSTLVRSGDVLALFIPDGVERSVALTVRGLDAPLVYPGRRVRLQFDGWPVFQFSGWPSSSIGTFGGIVDFVEPIADAQGYFRIWVSEDMAAGGWPSEQFVRLGSRVRGWVLLDEVKLGYELWRQLNNFPPINSGGSESESADASNES